MQFKEFELSDACKIVELLHSILGSNVFALEIVVRIGALVSTCVIPACDLHCFCPLFAILSVLSPFHRGLKSGR